MDSSNDERLTALESKVHEQNAQINGLLKALSDVLAAHAVLHKDVRLFSILKANRNHTYEMEMKGGTERVPASYFGARSGVFAELLQEAANSEVFDLYWQRSGFFLSEQKARDELDRIRQRVQKLAD